MSATGSPPLLAASRDAAQFNGTTCAILKLLFKFDFQEATLSQQIAQEFGVITVFWGGDSGTEGHLMTLALAGQYPAALLGRGDKMNETIARHDLLEGFKDK